MPRARIALFALGALLVVGLIFGAVSSAIAGGQRDAWLEGYTIGRLTAAAGVDGAVAPFAPYLAPSALPYGTGYATRGPGFGGPGFGGLLLFLLGAGALFFVGARLMLRARWQAWSPRQGSETGGSQGAPEAGPWRHTPRGCGPWRANWEQPQPAERTAEAQPRPTTPPPADPSSAPEWSSVQR
jgi:hypothetical protein